MGKNTDNIRNFCIIAHIDHGKSTLADRLLEITGTIEKRLMKPQYLDQLELERERGITIKMAPVRMLWHPSRIDADQNADKRGLLYKDLTYKIRGALFNVYNQLGPSYKENVYGNALEEELKKAGLVYEREKVIDVIYDGKKVGVYRPDFVVDEKIILELKAQPFIGKLEIKQVWHYLKGSDYRLALLVNFGSKELQIERIIYDVIRENLRLDPQESAKVGEYVLNLIDTPGHSDFRYEVSRTLAAVEGAVLLVDATQGIQAQTLANFESAKKSGLKIIGAVNKIDAASPEQIEESAADLVSLLGVRREEILLVSGKTGEGVEELLGAIINKIPSPQSTNSESITNKRIRKFETDSLFADSISRALIFDSLYDEHKGAIAFVRIFSGQFHAGDNILLAATKTEVKTKEVGYFFPQLKPFSQLNNGEIGYVATGLKDPDKLKIGDTIFGNFQFPISNFQNLALPGYKEPRPVVFVSFYPEDANKHEELKTALAKLRLTDSSLKFEPDMNEVLGRGFKGGFLGRLHFEITAERLSREFKIDTVHSFPSVAYRIRPRTYAEQTRTNAEKTSANSALSPRESAWLVITNPKDFPENPDEVEEPIAKIEILTPTAYLGPVLQLKEYFRFSEIETKNLGNNILIAAKLPLADLISDFDDKLKSVSSGFASLSYELIGYKKTEVVKLEILVAGHAVPGLARIVPKNDVEKIGRSTVEKLKNLLPKQQFSQALQAAVGAKILARETIPAMKKLLGNFGKTGGDRTRKMKLWKKQQRGKEKLKERAEKSQIKIPAHIFKELLKK